MNAPKRSALNIILFVVWVPILLLVVVGGVVVALKEPPPNPGAQRGGQLQGIAVTKDSNDVLYVCSRVDLHDCNVRLGNFRGRDYRLTVPLLHPRASCDHHRADAVAACTAPDGARAGDDCLAMWGMLAPSEDSQSDPRDPHLREGEFVLECAEGTDRGRFDPTP